MKASTISRIGQQIRHRQFIIYFTLFILYFLPIRAQPPIREQLAGTWIGVHSEWDTDFVCPLPTYIHLNADSVYVLGMVDKSAEPVRSTWAIRGNSVRLDTIHYAPGLVRIQGDLLRIGTYYPMILRRFNNVPLDSASVNRQLTGKVWQSDSLVVTLYANGRVSLENRLTKQRTVHFWQLVSFGQSVFVVIRGNQYNRDSGYKPMWQLTDFSANQWKAIGWNGRNVGTENFRLVRALTPGDSCRPGGFQTCDNCFRRMWYDISLSHSYRWFELKQRVTNRYVPVSVPGQSGLVRIRLVINCEGEMGQPEIAGFGEDYCPKPFDTRLTDQLLALCREQVATDPSLRISGQPDARPQDAAVSITFRLKDGRITDILP